MKSDKKPIRTTISALSFSRARKLMEDVYGMSDFNDLVERLITDEYERRHGPIKLAHFDPLSPAAPMLLNEPPKAKKKRKSRGDSSGSDEGSGTSCEYP